MKNELLSKVLKKADIPREIVLDIPYITLSGDFSFTLENHMGIITYDTEEIKINAKNRIIKIAGEKLSISNITDEIVTVEGIINKLEFV